MKERIQELDERRSPERRGKQLGLTGQTAPGQSGGRAVRHILIAIKDPGADPLPAVTKGIQLARAFGAQVELFHALDKRVYMDMLGVNAFSAQAVEADERAQVLQRLGRVAARARLHGVAVNVAAEWDYPAYEAIVRRAVNIGADLIVTECHPGRHVAPALLQLVDWEMVRLAPMPVLLVKSSRPYRHPTILAAVDPGHALAKPATLDEEILGFGTVMSEALRGKLHAVYALRPRVRERDEFERLLQSTGISSERRHCSVGYARDVVPETVERLSCEVIVMGAVSRSGLPGLLIGNTAEQLLDRLPCDLLIVKPPEFANRVSREPRGAQVLAVQPSC
jgi:universal stress protein E